jgi:hypothetical protein
MTLILCYAFLMLQHLRGEARSWCAEERNPWIRIPFLLWGIFIAWKIIRSGDGMTPIGFLNFGIHELGHMVFAVGGEWVGVAGGSFAQTIVPIYGAWQFLRQRDFFAASFCLSWLAESLEYLAVYIGDAWEMDLPPLTPFNADVLIHDWNYLLTSMNLVQKDDAIALKVRGVALLCELAFLWIGSWLIWQMIQAKRAR